MASVGESYTLIDPSRGNVYARAKIARGYTIAMAFLRGGDPLCYATIWSDLANQQTRGNAQFPTDLTLAYSMLVNYHSPRENMCPNNNNNNSQETTTKSNVLTGVGPNAFAQATRTTSTASTILTREIPGSDGIHHTITCFTCNKSGHYASNFPTPTSVALVQHAFIMTQ
jgi:hypothetical protein